MVPTRWMIFDEIIQNKTTTFDRSQNRTKTSQKKVTIDDHISSRGELFVPFCSFKKFIFSFYCTNNTLTNLK